MSESLDPTGRPRRNPDVIMRQLGDEAVLLDLSTNQYFGLNEVGTEIWNRIGEGKSLEEIISDLVGIFEVKREECEEDVLALARELVRNGLITLGDGPAS